MSTFFSDCLCVCLTSYFVLMATEVFHYSCDFSLCFPRYSLFQRCASFREAWLAGSAAALVESEGAVLHVSPDIGQERPALRWSWWGGGGGAQTQVEAPHRAHP